MVVSRWGVCYAKIHLPASGEVLLAESQGLKASLFVTCIVDQLYPEVGVSVVRVLRRLGVEVDFPREQACCGQPLFNSGFASLAKPLAKNVVKTFRDSPYVVVPSGSCAAMIRVFYQELLDDDPGLLTEVQKLGKRVYEFSEFLTQVLKVDELGAGAQGKATYHPSCHLLRELGVKEGPVELLGEVKGLELVDLPERETCCGFGGAFSVKYPHISEAMLAEKVQNVAATGADTLISCDMGCLMHIGGGLSRQQQPVAVKHLAQILDREGE